jgi:hypothetical protein
MWAVVEANRGVNLPATHGGLGLALWAVISHIVPLAFYIIVSASSKTT